MWTGIAEICYVMKFRAYAYSGLGGLSTTNSSSLAGVLFSVFFVLPLPLLGINNMYNSVDEHQLQIYVNRHEISTFILPDIFWFSVLFINVNIFV